MVYLATLFLESPDTKGAFVTFENRARWSVIYRVSKFKNRAILPGVVGIDN